MAEPISTRLRRRGGKEPPATANQATNTNQNSDSGILAVAEDSTDDETQLSGGQINCDLLDPLASRSRSPISQAVLRERQARAMADVEGEEWFAVRGRMTPRPMVGPPTHVQDVGVAAEEPEPEDVELSDEDLSDEPPVMTSITAESLGFPDMGEENVRSHSIDSYVAHLRPLLPGAYFDDEYGQCQAKVVLPITGLDVVESYRRHPLLQSWSYRKKAIPRGQTLAELLPTDPDAFFHAEYGTNGRLKMPERRMKEALPPTAADYERLCLVLTQAHQDSLDSVSPQQLKSMRYTLFFLYQMDWSSLSPDQLQHLHSYIKHLNQPVPIDQNQRLNTNTLLVLIYNSIWLLDNACIKVWPETNRITDSKSRMRMPFLIQHPLPHLAKTVPLQDAQHALKLLWDVTDAATEFLKDIDSHRETHDALKLLFELLRVFLFDFTPFMAQIPDMQWDAWRFDALHVSVRQWNIRAYSAVIAESLCLPQMQVSTLCTGKIPGLDVYLAGTPYKIPDCFQGSVTTLVSPEATVAAERFRLQSQWSGYASRLKEEIAGVFASFADPIEADVALRSISEEFALPGRLAGTLSQAETLYEFFPIDQWLM